MGLQFVFGGSGAGKSTLVYEKLIRQSMEHPRDKYFVMVPDQFTMYTQKELCLMHPRGGIMNIDVLSFSRLIHRISEEVGRKERAVLDDTGKNLVLRRVAMEKENELVLLKEKVKKPGYIHEVKSVISEFYQYDIHAEDIAEMAEQAEGKGALAYKMKELGILYGGFADYIKNKFITTEESLDELCGMIPQSGLLAGSVIVFDGFTGFTPVQNRVLLKLMQVAKDVVITLCADNIGNIENVPAEQELFALSEKTYRRLTALAKENDIPVHKPVFVDGKPVRRYTGNAAMAFLEANLFRYGQETFEGEQQAISVWEADGLVAELQRLCLEINRLVREEGLYYRDIAVVTGDLERYAHLFRTEFVRYGIPYFLDQNRGVTHHPLTEYLKSALGMWKERFSYESVFRFLRSGMSSLTMDETDRLENYVRACGIRGLKAYTEPFTYGGQAEEMNGLREKLLEELSPLFGEFVCAKDYAAAVYELCHKNHLQEKCNAYAEQFDMQGDASKAKEYEKIYPACMDLLNQIYELIGEDRMDMSEFLEIFEAGLSEIRIGTIPQNVDQVVVGDIERTRLKKIRVLFFVGVNDGVIPGTGGGGGLLSDMERQFFLDRGRELAPSVRQKIFEQRLYLYQTMTKPTERLYLSYSKVNGEGKAILPSYLIRTIQGMYPSLKTEKVTGRKTADLSEISSKEDGLDDYAGLLRVYLNHETASEEEENVKKLLTMLVEAYGEDEVAGKIREAALTTYENVPLSDMAAELLYKERNKGSVSRLEQFAACAYAHFLRYGLELKEQEEYDFDAMDFGIVYHHVLECLSRELSKQRVTFAEAEEGLVRELIDRAFDEYAEEYGGYILHSSSRNEHRIGQMKKVLMQSVTAMQYQLSKGAFVPSWFEKNFRMQGDFLIVGKIDRIDICRENGKVYVKVVDYKSGNKKLSLEEVYYGLSLQLPAYMNAALEMLRETEPESEIVPASMLYSRLQNPYVDETVKDVEAELRSLMRPEGLSADADEILTLLDEESDGKSDVVRIARNKDGSLSKSSQAISEEAFATVLSYTQHKMNELMKEMRGGEIGAEPAHIEKDKNSSCTYCSYRGICGMDMRIPGYAVKELPKMEEEDIEEEMRNEIYAETAGSNNNEK